MNNDGTTICIFYDAIYNDGHIDERVYTIEYAFRISRRDCEREYKTAHHTISQMIDNPNIIDIRVKSADYYGVK